MRALNASASLICSSLFSSPGCGGGSYTDAVIRARRGAAFDVIVAERWCVEDRRSPDDDDDEGPIESKGFLLDEDAAEGDTAVYSVWRRVCLETNFGGGRGEDEGVAAEGASTDFAFPAFFGAEGADRGCGSSVAIESLAECFGGLAAPRERPASDPPLACEPLLELSASLMPSKSTTRLFFFFLPRATTAANCGEAVCEAEAEVEGDRRGLDSETAFG